jgi:hypothetical protein
MQVMLVYVPKYLNKPVYKKDKWLCLDDVKTLVLADFQYSVEKEAP